MSAAPVARSRELQRLAGGAGLSLAGRVVNGALILLYGVVAARLLDVHSVGVLMLGLAVVRMAEVLARSGLEIGTVQQVAIAAGNPAAAVRATVRNAIVLVLATSLLLAALLAAAAPALARSFAMPELSNVLRILAVSLPGSSAAMVLLAALLGLKAIGYSTLGEKILLPALNLGLCGLLLASGFGLAGAGVAYVAAPLLVLPYAVRCFRRCAPARAGTAVSRGALLRLSTPIVLVALLTQLLGWIDTFMLGLLRGAGEVGIYSAAARTALVAGLVSGALSAIFAPTIAELYARGDLARLGYFFKTVGKWMFLATLPLVLLLMLLAEELLLVFGAPFAAGATALSILALAQLAVAASGAVGFVLTMSGRQRLMAVDTLAACAANVALNLLLIPQAGMAGAAAATCLAVMLFSAMALLQVRRALGMHPFGGGYAKVLAAGTAPFLLLLAAKAVCGSLPYPLAIVAFSLAYAALYVLGLRILGFDREDALILSTLKRKLQRPA